MVGTIAVLLVDNVLVRPQFSLVNWIKVGSILCKSNFGLVWGFFLPQITVEVDSPEELMVLDLVGAVLAEPPGLVGAQPEDQGLGLAAEAEAGAERDALLAKPCSPRLKYITPRLIQAMEVVSSSKDFIKQC